MRQALVNFIKELPLCLKCKTVHVSREGGICSHCRNNASARITSYTYYKTNIKTKTIATHKRVVCPKCSKEGRLYISEHRNKATGSTWNSYIIYHHLNGKRWAHCIKKEFVPELKEK